jgi:hypothetical protein
MMLVVCDYPCKHRSVHCRPTRRCFRRTTDALLLPLHLHPRTALPQGGSSPRGCSTSPKVGSPAQPMSCANAPPPRPPTRNCCLALTLAPPPALQLYLAQLQDTQGAELLPPGVARVLK